MTKKKSAKTKGYDVALRPDVPGGDPMSYNTRLDDIVVKDVAMFRAEAMDDHAWWVGLWLANGGYMAFALSAKCRPRRLEWTVSSFPDVPVTYEHECQP